MTPNDSLLHSGQSLAQPSSEMLPPAAGGANTDTYRQTLYREETLGRSALNEMTLRSLPISGWRLCKSWRGQGHQGKEALYANRI